jgi:hypothetical protein
LVPHCDVFTAPAFAVLPDDGVLELLLQPAATSAPTTATSAAAVRAPGACILVPT